VTDTAAGSRLFLSPPHLSGGEAERLTDALQSNWIAPIGPHIDAFEAEFAAAVGSPHAVALSSGTGALHLALIAAGVGSGDEVLVSSLTFSASVNPIRYVGAAPVLVDSERESWNLDPALVEKVLVARAARGRQIKAIIPVHLYGQSADMAALVPLCERFGVTIIEDAAEALGATCHGRHPGVFGRAGIFSFNGNKIITTSGGGMLVTPDESLALHVRKLASQAREPAPHYLHHEIGFNYRLSNLLAAFGRAQLETISARVAARRAHFEAYRSALGDLPGIVFQPEAKWGRHTRWLSALTIDPIAFGADRESVRMSLEAENIESRPVWMPMHRQPVFASCEFIGSGVSDAIFDTGLCLPSGSAMTPDDRSRVIDVVRRLHARER